MLVRQDRIPYYYNTENGEKTWNQPDVVTRSLARPPSPALPCRALRLKQAPLPRSEEPRARSSSRTVHARSFSLVSPPGYFSVKR